MVLYLFVLMLLDSVGSVNINHFPWRVCKSIDLNPKYMEQFVKILTSIVCRVIGLSIWEAIRPQHHKNKACMVANSLIYPENIYCILLCARFQRYMDD